MLQTKNFAIFNPEQRHALDTRRNLAVRANAGSGKTSVLVERIVQMLARHRREGSALTLSDIVAITFTRKAASELQERLRGSFRECVSAAATTEERAFWSARIDDIPRAMIGTIDSFCGRILRDYAWLATAHGLEPDFEPLDPYDADVLKEEAIDRVLNRLSAAGRAAREPPAQIEACKWWAEQQGYDSLTRHLGTLLNHPVDPEKIVVTHHHLPPASQRVDQHWSAHPTVSRFFGEGDSLRATLTEAANRFTSARKKTEIAEALTLVLDEWNQTERDEIIATLERLRALLYTQKGEVKKKGFEFIKDLVSPAQESWQSYLVDFAFDAVAEQTAYEAADRLACLLEPVQAEYLALCQDAGRLDFTAIARRTRSLLANSSKVRDELRRRWRYFLVDEFQDTNRLQWQIISWLVGAGPDGPLDVDRLFIVGDPQQSIYRFRHADVSVFAAVERLVEHANRAHALGERDTDYDEFHGQRISRSEQRLGLMPLRENHRTLDPVPLTLLDRVFEHTFDPVAHGLDRKRNAFEVTYQSLVPAKRGDGTVEYIIPGDNASAEESDEEMEGEGAAKREVVSLPQVNAVVARFVALHGEPKLSGKVGETLRWSDMAVLLPSRTVVLTELEKAFRRCNVPFIVAGGIGFWQRQEVRDIVNLAATLSDPGDELALFAVLRGPLGLLTDTECLFLSQLGGRNLSRGLQIAERLGEFASLSDSDPWLAVAESARPPLEQVWRDFASDTQERIVRVARRMRGWRQRVDRLTHSDLVQRCLEESGAYAIYAAELDGALILANLTRLCGLIREQELRSAPSLTHLTRRLRDQVDGSFKEEQATLAVDQDAVQIMTVHAAKGLEFPVVAVLKMERRADHVSHPALRVVSEGDALLAEDAPAFPDVAPGMVSVRIRHPQRPREMYSPRLHRALGRLDRAQQLAESRRLFYVAATRAKERLILVGRPPRPKKNGEPGKLPVSWQQWFENALPLDDTHKVQRLWEDAGQNLRVTIITEEAFGDAIVETTPLESKSRFALQEIVEISKLSTIAVTRLIEMLADWRRDRQRWWLIHRAYLMMGPCSIAESGLLDGRAPRIDLGSAIGTIVHRLVPLVMGATPRGKSSLRALAEAMALNALRAEDRGISEESIVGIAPRLVRETARTASGIIERLRDDPRAGEVRKLVELTGDLEVPFSLRLGRYLVSGRFDKLIPVEACLAIVDWKTSGKGPVEQTVERYRMQAQLYALALYRAGLAGKDRQPIAVHLVLFHHMHVETLKFTCPDLEAFERDWLAELEAMDRFVAHS